MAVSSPETIAFRTAVRREIGRRILRLRQSRRWSAVELSEACGAAVNVIWCWERGACAPAVESLLRVAAAFEVPLTDLVPDNAWVQNALEEADA